MNLIKNVIDANWFKYIVYGKETVPMTGAPHLQGFLILISKKRLNFIKNTIFQSENPLRVSRAKGPPKAADYRKKRVINPKPNGKSIIPKAQTSGAPLYSKKQDLLSLTKERGPTYGWHR